MKKVMTQAQQSLKLLCFQELELEPESNEELDQLVDLWHQLGTRDGQIDDITTIFDYLEIDDNIATAEEPSLNEIAQQAVEDDRAGGSDEDESSFDIDEYFYML